MGLEYVNRRDERYFLQEGKTATGKPKFYAARKLTGKPLEQIPPGYEIHENPEQAQVMVRKVRPTSIVPSEQELLAEAVRRHARLEQFLLDVQGNSLVIYLPNADADGAIALARLIGGGKDHVERVKQLMMRNAHYTKMMRFNLVDEEERLYTAERWCFLGSIDNWFLLGARPAPLADLAKKYLKHLGQESFFELM